jgi:hypothetical protein
MLRRGGGQLLVMDGPGDAAGICPLRALAEVLAAALGLDRLDPTVSTTPSPDELADTLELYRWGDGYAEVPGTDLVSSDDNALVALTALRAHGQLRPPVPDSLWLHRAKRTFEVVADGPVKADLARQLHLATGIDRYLLFEAGSTAGSTGPDVDDRADERAPDPDADWRRPPAANAARFRRLLQDPGADRPPRLLAELDRYLERVWREGRDPATGQFRAGGIGRSPGAGATLDHAALVQLFALQAAPPPV